jgi:membrane protease YdiL (CAAX protease family)
VLKHESGFNQVTRWLAGFFGEPLERVADEQRAFLSSDEGQRADREVMVVLVAAAVVLTLQYYWFVSGQSHRVISSIERLLPAALGESLAAASRSPQNAQLVVRAYWALGMIGSYVLIPALLIKLVFRRKLSDYGAKLNDAASCWWAYVLMYLGILPFVILASFRDSFLHTYPFYRLAANEPLWPRFVIWELLYALQFVSLEFFFRGFLLHGTRRRFGVYAIFVMMVPYCMIHFGKPMPETFGAIGAGVILGFMSLKTRSIWMGAALHIAVAWTMDAAALWHRG